MKTPYQVLDVKTNAIDAEIKRAYLLKVKECPPDRDQETFQSIHNAYTTIKDIKSRLRYDLFTLPAADFDDFIDHALLSEGISELKPELFNKLLRASVDDSSFLNTIGSLEKHE